MKATPVYGKEEEGVLYLSSIKYNDDYKEGTKWNSTTITKVVIENPIAPATATSMFSGNTNMKSIENIENLHTENISDMKYMFNSCSSLEN